MVRVRFLVNWSIYMYGCSSFRRSVHRKTIKVKDFHLLNWESIKIYPWIYLTDGPSRSSFRCVLNVK